MPAVNDSIPTYNNNPTANPQQGRSFIDSQELFTNNEECTDNFTVDQLLSIQPDSASYNSKTITAKEMYGMRSTLLTKPVHIYDRREDIPREYPLGNSWAFIPIIGVILLALLLVRYTRGYTSQLFLLLISHKAAHKQYKSNIQNFNRILLILMLFSIVPTVIFATFILHHFPNHLDIGTDYELFLIVGCFLLVFFVFKSIVLSSAGVLTYSESLIQELNYNSRIFLGSWGILTLPFVLLLTLNDNESDKTIFFFIIVGLSILLIILYLARSFQLFLSEKVSIFFWILYLCTLELLPVLLVFDYLFPFK